MITKKKNIFFFFLLTCNLFLPASLFNVHSTNQLGDSESVQSFETWLNNFHKNNTIPSISVGIVKDNKLIYEHYINSNSHKIYNLASITKTLTATAVMQLAEQNKISLDDPITDYFPELILENPELKSKPVRIRHLLSHTAGLPDLRFYETPSFNQFKLEEQALIVPRQIYPTGMHYRYSNSGYIILGKLIEKIKKRSLASHMQQEIFNKIGMTDTAYSPYHSGAYGIQSSLHDMSRYAIFALNKGVTFNQITLLKKETFQSMLKNQLNFPDSCCNEYCGLGWRVREIHRRPVTFFHIGGSNNAAAWIQMFPEENTAILYLADPPQYTKTTEYFLSSLQIKLADLSSNFRGMNLNKIPLAKTSISFLHKFPGVYVKKDGVSKIKITRAENKLRLWNSNGSYYNLYGGTVNIFYGSENYTSHEFVFDKNKTNVIGMARYDGYYTRLE